MNTLEFLQAILPEDGIKFIVEISKGRAPKHHPFTSLEEMAAAIERLDKTAGSIYHACSSFNEEFVWVEEESDQEELEQVKKWRVDANWRKAKAFWCDVDCGEEYVAKNKGYLNKKEAVAAIKAMCITLNLPAPLVIDSGNGLHCYWPLTKAIPSATWVKMARVLKAAFASCNFLADPTRTADFSSILRPVGATNKKSEPRPVVSKNTVTPIDPADFAERLKSVKLEHKIEVPADRPALNDDLTAHLAPPPSVPSFAEVVANNCAQLAAMRDTQGDVGYEHWRGVIGIIKHCEEGIDLARKWSERREETGHSQNDVDTKYNTWSSPPATCEFFSKCNPEGCVGCPHKGKIKTPIVLGRKEPESTVAEVEATVEGKIVTYQIPELPKGYGHSNNVMSRYLKDKDDIMQAHVFSANLFYPTHRVRKENGEFSIGIRMHLPDKRVRDFEIDTQVLASPQKTIEGLARYELIPTNHKDATVHMNAYLRDSLEKLKREAEELNTYTSFGWKDDYQSFLIGDRLYCRDGMVKKVLVGGYAKDMASAFPVPTGKLESYSHALNHLYARSGMEPMQYAIASGFGSVLSPLGDSMYKGLIMAITGEDTAKGKTTVCWASLYAFGDADKMSLKTEDNATVNARYARMGAYCNLPLLIDELTNIEPEEFSKLAYTVSLGQERERLTTGRGAGTRFAETQNWSLAPYVTANKDLHAVLAARQSNTQAEAVRMIQIKIDRYELPKMKVSEVETAKKQMEINKGVAGDIFLRYVVANLDDVIKRMQRWGVKIEEDISDVKYRFYRSHAICSLTALEITNELGITQFPLDSIYRFVIGLFHELAEAVTEQNTVTSDEALNRMLNELSPRILVTNEYRDGRDARGPEDGNRILGAVAGRYIMGSLNTKGEALAGKLLLIRKEITDWCLKHRVDHKTMIDAAVAIGVAREVKDKFNVGRGTRISAGQHRVVEFDMHKMEAALPNSPKLTVYTVNKIEGSEVANK